MTTDIEARGQVRCCRGVSYTLDLMRTTSNEVVKCNGCFTQTGRHRLPFLSYRFPLIKRFLVIFPISHFASFHPIAQLTEVQVLNKAVELILEDEHEPCVIVCHISHVILRAITQSNFSNETKMLCMKSLEKKPMMPGMVAEKKKQDKAGRKISQMRLVRWQI